MICVAIGRSRHRHMMGEHKHLVEQGAKLIELRLDYIKGDVQMKRILENRSGPVIITCRREEDGGKFTGSEESRQAILRMAIAEGVEYVDLEEDIAAAIPRFGETKRIISLHDFRKTPDNLDEIHARLARLDPDIVKISTMANSPSDNLRMLKLVKNASVSTIGICMGEMGTVSRILAGRFGAPFTYATFHQERTLAPGQLSFHEMQDTYHYEEINESTDIYAVIADPVGHSLSPQIHNAALRHEGINAAYVPIRVPREHLSHFLRDAPELGVKGLSVTIPHKEAVVAHLNKADRVVVDTEAANTVVYQDGVLVGYNTDVRAAIDSLEVHFPAGADPDEYLKGKTALVLGAGGAAKAVAYGLMRRGASVVVASRTRERADELAEKLGGRAVDWKGRHGVECSVLVNCTPIGMHPDVDNTPFDRHSLKPGVLVFDTVYNPENTLFVKGARAQGCATVTGTEMFLRQAALQFKLFTDRDAPVDVMRDVLKKAIGAVKY